MARGPDRRARAEAIVEGVTMEDTTMPTIAEIIQDPRASAWLKQSLIDAVLHDPQDALEDALILVALLSAEIEIREED